MGLGPGADTDGVQGKHREGKTEGLHASRPSLLVASRILQHHALMYPCRFCDSEVTPSISDTRIPHSSTQLHTEAAAQRVPTLPSSPFCHPALHTPIWGRSPPFSRVPPARFTAFENKTRTEISPSHPAAACPERGSDHSCCKARGLSVPRDTALPPSTQPVMPSQKATRLLKHYYLLVKPC